MKTKVAFFGSDQYSQIVLDQLKKSPRIEITNQETEIGVLASYGKILSLTTLEKFPSGILNLHPSLLPQYRGPSPVQTALLEGKTTTGITIIKMDQEIDHGPIVWQKEVRIKPEETAGQLYQRLFSLGTKALLEFLPAYLKGELKLKEQDHSQTSYTQKLIRESGFIPLERIFHQPDLTFRKIRAYSPWPGAWTKVEINHQNKRLKILKAHLEKKELILDQVQLEGKNSITFKQLLEGYPQIKTLFSQKKPQEVSL